MLLYIPPLLLPKVHDASVLASFLSRRGTPRAQGAWIPQRHLPTCQEGDLRAQEANQHLGSCPSRKRLRALDACLFPLHPHGHAARPLSRNLLPRWSRTFLRKPRHRPVQCGQALPVSQILSAPQSGVCLFCRFLTRQSYPCMIMAHPRQLPLVYPSDLVNRQATCQSQETQVFALPRSLTSPFVMPKAPAVLESIPNPCTKQFHTTAKPTSPYVTSTKPLTETVTSVCHTPQIKDIGVPKEIKHFTGLRNEDNDTNGRSTPHRVHAHSKEGSCDATYTLKPNYHSYVAPHTTYSPSRKNALVDTPSSGHVSPPAALPLGVGDGVDSAQFAAFSRASHTLGHSTPPVPSSSTFPSTPFRHEHDESERRTMFKPFIHVLLAARECGISHPLRSTIGLALVQSDNQVYQRAGVSKFRDYATLAEQAGIVELGGRGGSAWIALHPNWFEVDGNITTTPFLSTRVQSPMPDPPKAIQNPSKLSGSEIPLIGTAIFPRPTSTSPKPNSPASNTFPTLPADRQDSASRASIPPQFQLLIDILVGMRAEGSYQIFRSAIGTLLGQDVYARAGVPGLKEYIIQASEAQLIQFGGVGGHAWIRLHPELRI